MNHEPRLNICFSNPSIHSSFRSAAYGPSPKLFSLVGLAPCLVVVRSRLHAAQSPLPHFHRTSVSVSPQRSRRSPPLPSMLMSVSTFSLHAASVSLPPPHSSLGLLSLLPWVAAVLSLIAWSLIVWSPLFSPSSPPNSLSVSPLTIHAHHSVSALSFRGSSLFSTGKIINC